jgi:hypothetical protein
MTNEQLYLQTLIYIRMSLELDNSEHYRTMTIWLKATDAIAGRAPNWNHDFEELVKRSSEERLDQKRQIRELHKENRAQLIEIRTLKERMQMMRQAVTYRKPSKPNKKKD